MVLLQRWCRRCWAASESDDKELRPLTEEVEREGEERRERWRRVLVVALLCIISFLVAIAYSVVGSFFPIQAVEKGTNVLVTGIIISVSPLCLVIFSPIFGYFLPKLGTKMTLISGHMLVGGAFFLMGFLDAMPSGTVFVVFGILLRMTEGVGWAMTLATTFALLPSLFPSRIGTLTGLIFGVMGLGFTIGPPIGSVIVVVAGYGAPFWAIGGFTFCLVPLTFLLVKETSSSSKVLPMKVVLKLISNPGFSMIQIADMLGISSLTFMDASLAIYLNSEIGFNLLDIGLAFALLSVCYMFGSFVAGQLADKWGTRVLIIAGLFICGASLILLGLNALIPISRRWTILIALALIGWGASQADVPTYSDLLQQARRLYPEENEEALISAVSGITAFSQTFGNFLGAFSGGFLSYLIDFPTATQILGEGIIAHGFIVLGVSLIDHILKQ